jgi:3-oxoacyl-[acyl-carrier protein] reductase
MAVEQAHAKQALNGICNCVGSLMLKPAHLISQDDWHHTITINLTSAFNVVHAATKTLKKPASIVLMSSAAALIGLPNHEAISAAKAGINGLVLAAASSYANRGLRFNAVAPGLVKTPLTDALIKNPQALEISLNSHPLGRLGEAADCSQAIQYLLSPNNSWVSGQILAVDGGLSTLKKTISSKAG